MCLFIRFKSSRLLPKGGRINLTLRVTTRVVIERGWIGKMTRHEAIFYPVMFLLTFQMATMFESSRDFLQLASSFASYLLTRV